MKTCGKGTDQMDLKLGAMSNTFHVSFDYSRVTHAFTALIA